MQKAKIDYSELFERHLAKYGKLSEKELNDIKEKLDGCYNDIDNYTEKELNFIQSDIDFNYIGKWYEKDY